MAELFVWAAQVWFCGSDLTPSCSKRDGHTCGEGKAFETYSAKHFQKPARGDFSKTALIASMTVHSLCASLSWADKGPHGL
jgi:hypothetical protein